MKIKTEVISGSCFCLYFVINCNAVTLHALMLSQYNFKDGLNCYFKFLQRPIHSENYRCSEIESFGELTAVYIWQFSDRDHLIKFSDAT